MVNVFSEKETDLMLNNTKGKNDNYKRVIKHRIINKLVVILKTFKILVPSKINNMKIRTLLNRIGLLLYPNVVEYIITDKLLQDKIDKDIETELETYLINQHSVIKIYLKSTVLNSKMKKILRNIQKDIRRVGFY